MEDRPPGTHKVTLNVWSRPLASPRWGDRWSLTCFLLGFGVLLVLAERLVARLPTTGDEPWYLLQTYALIHLHSANLAPLVHDHPLYAHFLRTAPDDHTYDYLGTGERVLWYLPGYAATIAPFYLLGGRPLVVAFQALAAALTGALVFGEAQRLFGSREVALFTWLAYILPLPVLLYAGQIFPSTLAACAIFLGYVLVTRSLAAAQGQRLVLVGLSIGLITSWLPWLHMKYLLPALLLVGIALLVLRPRLRVRQAARADRHAWVAAALILGLTLLSLLLISVYSHHYFGTWTPPNAKQQPHWLQPRFDLVGALYGSMFLDPRTGLLPWVPLDLLVIPGLALLLRRYPRRASAILAMLVAQFATYLSAAVSPVLQGTALIARFTLESSPFFALGVGAVFAAVSRLDWHPVRSWRLQLSPSGTTRLLVAVVGLVLLGATTWFSAVGELAPWFLYPRSTLVLLTHDKDLLPSAWFALFPRY